MQSGVLSGFPVLHHFGRDKKLWEPFPSMVWVSVPVPPPPTSMCCHEMPERRPSWTLSMDLFFSCILLIIN